jgi:tRNA A-37 threonylcarbamoyl transferase component Bud32
MGAQSHAGLAMMPTLTTPSGPPSSGAASARAVAAAARYFVEEELASGGMGVVYRVFDRVAGEARALKRVRPEALKERLYVEAFEREYHVLATLDHPGIIRVFDFGVDERGPYYTMELLSGRDMRKAAPLPYREACAHLRDVATSLALLHARRLVHRDLSPSNVRMTDGGHSKLLDFGTLAAFGTSDVVAGTPPAVPPEAFSGAPLDQRTDLYSLGALAYWVLTGRHAYPAQTLEDLPARWRIAPSPPSAIIPGIPEQLDDLVLSLLSADPLARPASAAEVIARLSTVGDLPPEGTTETRRLALSFLSNPRFIGRADVLESADAAIQAGVEGRGRALCFQAVAGMGRSRLLEEIALRAQMAGAAVVRVDANMHRQTHGTARALALRTIDALPDLARKHSTQFLPALSAIGRDVRAKLGSASFPSAPPGVDTTEVQRSLGEWFAEISRGRPLVLLVDNVERADDASLGLLAGLATDAADHAVVVVTTECARGAETPPIGLTTLRNQSLCIELGGLGAVEIVELVRSLFGDAPSIERFAEWIFERTAGSPLHALEISRQLLAKNVISYSAGVWTLPDHAPDAELPAALGDALSIRLAPLGEPARVLAECLSLQRQQPTFELCALLSSHSAEHGVLALLDELAERDVLYEDRDGYRFSSSALQDALLAGMDDARLEQNHRRVGEAFASLAGTESPKLRIEAGWHLIQGGEELRGADLIASAAHDSVTTRELFANLHHIGRPIEAALKVYGKYRRSAYQRMPLLAGLAQAGFYEDRSWADRYGDEALDVVEDLSGVGTARRLRRFCGGWLALVLGILVAFVRFHLVPRRERKYSFGTVMVHLFSSVTSLAGVASLSFDVERTEQVASVLEPFAVLPKRLTPVGIYQFCRGLREIGRENQAVAYETFDTLLARFQDPRYYPTLPSDARKFYVAGAHFVRGSFGIFRADGRGALESAEALDRTGLKIYAMIASQLRWLYYTLRGEFSRAASHRVQLEVHAAHVGSVWQVETWQAAALLLVYPQIGDIVGSTRLAHRIELLSRTVPSMKRYAGLARSGILLSRREPANKASIARVIAEYETHVPRSYIGWAGSRGYVARGHNVGGEHDKAKAVCEKALAHVTDVDREYVLHFITLDLELAVADAALGQTDAAMHRIDGLIARYEEHEHRLALGLLHETRANIAWAAGKGEQYERSLREVERWFLPTKEPALIAKCKRLSELGRESVSETVDRSPADPREAAIASPKSLEKTVISGREKR